jgi:hypothetical protein
MIKPSHAKHPLITTPAGKWGDAVTSIRDGRILVQHLINARKKPSWVDIFTKTRFFTVRMVKMAREREAGVSEDDTPEWGNGERSRRVSDRPT